MATQHDGVVVDSATYTTHAIARIFGVRGNDTIDRWVAGLGVPVARIGTRTFVSGQQFREAVERASRQSEGGAAKGDDDDSRS